MFAPGVLLFDAAGRTRISAALSAAVQWEWITVNAARIAQRPRQKAPEPDPPSASDAARLLDAAFAMDDEWRTLVWLVMTTGIRRGEVCALRWARCRKRSRGLAEAFVEQLFGPLGDVRASGTARAEERGRPCPA